MPDAIRKSDLQRVTRLLRQARDIAEPTGGQGHHEASMLLCAKLVEAHAVARLMLAEKRYHDDGGQ